ncbi:hypothetical protein [Pandoraea sputorum]|uniref:Uncharacterized protein n=1 Tax=Pandoraea sputorum TaxID=93222 RepID=A0A5E5BI86_9BURK|nr:hypothetical protein [Pandoraea sputorum]VVE85559.1 hypothetical protein PSP31121_05301 [Pandoraea sputorum]
MAMSSRIIRFLRGVPGNDTDAQRLGRLCALDANAVNPYRKGSIAHGEWTTSRQDRQKLLAYILLW